jgi:hypothetical protein
MTGEEMLGLFEQGKAAGVETTVLIIRVQGTVFVSFDGEEWVESKSEFINKQLD